MDNEKEAVPQNRPQHIDSNPVLWTPQQVAEYFSISIRTLYNGTKRNAAPPFPVKPIRIGRALRWDPAAIQAFVKGGSYE